ncbi:unnamed protein product [Leptosia nina]|uniref:PHD-type domain-containing protein n=1 Tax=Leptosia nina TaxID=320188 RepID=A0AAV1J7V9_9NEOP
MSGICPKCRKQVSDSVLCSQCDEMLHYGCAGVTETSYRKMGPEKRGAWRCLNCRQSASQLCPSPENCISITELMKELKEFRNDFNTFSADLQSVKADMEKSIQAIQTLSAKWGDFETRLSNVEDRISSVEQKLSSLTTVQDDLSTANRTIDDLRNVIDVQDQFSRLNNVEINGIPSRTGENLLELVNNIFSVVGLTLDTTDIDSVHRVRPFVKKNEEVGQNEGRKTVRPPAIVIRFTRRRRKDELLAAARARRGLSTVDIRLDGPSLPIFLNEHLTPSNKLLLRQARSLKQQFNYSHLWVRDCKILIRKNDKSPIFTIKNERDLGKIK